MSRPFPFIARLAAFAGATLAITPFLSCATKGQAFDLRSDQDPNASPDDAVVVRLTLLHTSDIHSRLFPYDYTPLLPDTQAGLPDGKGPYGGISRMAYILNRERGLSDRVVHLNGGDMFEGAPVFNYFQGEPEIRALSQLGCDAMVIANHEFDKGPFVVFDQLQKWATFPVLAANYSEVDPSFSGNPPLAGVLTPYTILDVQGLRVGVIGMGNLSTVTSIFNLPNQLGILPYDTTDVAQFYIDFLRPQVDLIVFLTHLGLEEDERMIAGTEGIDVVLGGHNHIVISPPKEEFDCGGVDAPTGSITVGGGPTGDTPTTRPCIPRKVLLMHSGAFAKFVGRLDLDVTDSPSRITQASGKGYDSINGFEVVSHAQQVFPIDVDTPDDVGMDQLLEPYQQQLTNIGNLDLLVGYAPAEISRTAPAAGDSALGNLISTSMWLRLGVQTDFSMTNTTGIRADLSPGPVSITQMFNIFPFDNTITTMQLSGEEVVEMFDYNARRSQSRSCVSQIQIAGSFIAMNCNGCDPDFRPDAVNASSCTEQVFIGYDGRSCTADTDCNPNAKLARFNCDKTVGQCRFSVIRYGQDDLGNPVVTEPGTYSLATSNYLAAGGSGFLVLKANTTQLNTQINQRDAVTDFVRYANPCGWQTNTVDPDSSGMLTCAVDADCASIGDYVCACPDNTTVGPGSPISCSTSQTCDPAVGRCVLRQCRDDVASYNYNQECAGGTGASLTSCEAMACSQGGESCKVLACIDSSVGALVDGRQVMLNR